MPHWQHARYAVTRDMATATHRSASPAATNSTNEVGWIVIDLASSIDDPHQSEDMAFAYSMRTSQIWLRAVQVAPCLSNGFMPETAWSVVGGVRLFKDRYVHMGDLCSRNGPAHHAEAGQLLVHGHRYLAENYIALWRSVAPMPLELLQLRGLAIRARVSLDSKQVAERCARSNNPHTRAVLHSAAIKHSDPGGMTTWDFEVGTVKALRLAHDLYEIGRHFEGGAEWTFQVVDLGPSAQRSLDLVAEECVDEIRVSTRGETLTLFAEEFA